MRQTGYLLRPASST